MRPGPRQQFTYDFAVYDSQRRLSALVEAKLRFGKNASWAVAWHALSIEGADAPADANIVLVLADRIYAWRPGAGASSSPDWTLDAEPMLAPYFTRLKIPVGEVHPRVFEQIVWFLLSDIVEGASPGDGGVRGAEGLFDALRGGEIVQQVAA